MPEYENQIKCIYIDPPYNTGNENWVYNDNVNSPEIQAWLGKTVGKEAEDLSRHDKWLCMMYPRLTLLRKLLKNDGVIFISIDDNEQANLKLLCDEIFGESNFVACLPTVMNLKGNQDQFAFAGTHEYTMVYAKNKNITEFYGLSIDEESLEEWQEDEIGFYKKGANLKSTGGNAPREKRPNLFYPIYISENNEVFLERQNDLDIELLPITDGQEMSWRWSKGKVQNETYDIIVSKDSKNISLYKKQRPDLGELPSKKPKSLFYKPEYSSGNGTAQIKAIFGDKLFQTPKPVNLIEDLLKISTKNDDIILDSFAGSGTTAHAVLNLNQADGGNRKFILIECQDYAETITAERVRRIISPQGLQALAGMSSGFSFYKLGEPLLIDEQLNNACELEDIRKYIWHTEAPQPPTGGVFPPSSMVGFAPPVGGKGAYFLGSFNETDIYFYYEKDKATYLDYDFLATISQKAEHYLIYADVCYLSKEFMEANHIRFKKIPRDITRI